MYSPLNILGPLGMSCGVGLVLYQVVFSLLSSSSRLSKKGLKGKDTLGLAQNHERGGGPG